MEGFSHNTNLEMAAESLLHSNASSGSSLIFANVKDLSSAR